MPWPSKVTSNGGRHLLLLSLQDLHLGVDRLDRVLSLLHLAVHPLNQVVISCAVVKREIYN